MNGGPVHPGDLLSACADGQLTDAERVGVDAHLASCPGCRKELEVTRRAKDLVAGLPEVQAPFGFFERMLLDPSARSRGPRDGRVVRAGAVALAAAAASWLAVVGLTGLTGDRPGGLPALNSLVTIHEEATPTEHSAGDEGEQLRIEEEAAALGLPPSMGAYQLLDVTGPLAELGQPRQATYRSGDLLLSAFVYLGYDILEGRLPAGTRELLLSSGRGWIVPVDPSPVVLVQAGANAVVLIGPDPALSMADDVEPRDPDPSLMDRVEGAGEGLLEAFGLG